MRVCILEGFLRKGDNYITLGFVFRTQALYLWQTFACKLHEKDDPTTDQSSRALPIWFEIEFDLFLLNTMIPGEL